MRPLYGVLFDEVKFQWSYQMETLFQQIKTSFAENVTLTLPHTNQLFLLL